MNNLTKTAAAALFLLSANGALAQERGAPPQPDRPFHAHTELIGLDLVVDKPGADGKPIALGTIDDLVLDGATGQLSHVIVEREKALRAIAWKDVTWGRTDDGALQPTAEMSVVDLEARPTLKEKDADLIVGRRPAASDAERSHLLTEAGDASVLATTARTPIATVDDLVLDLHAGRVAFATVTLERKQYLVPTEKILLRLLEREEKAKKEAEDGAEADDEGPKLVALLAMSKDALADAPTIDAEKEATPSHPRFRDAVYRYYGVANPDLAKGARN
ncbi:MAG: hypothetical protein AAGB93_00025 [Planctomycetota bacterium]